MKTPSKKELKEAISGLENSDLFYKYAPNFQGVNIKDVELQYVDEMDTPEDKFSRKVFYTAEVCYLGRKDTHYDCYVTIKELIGFLPKHYSLK